MALVTSKRMLMEAQKDGYAIGAFNVDNMEMIKAVIEAAEELKAPVIIQTTPSTVKYGSLETYKAIVAAEAKKASVPICLHLDHGSSFDLTVQAIRAGYTSVMIDGSHEDFERNITLTKKVVDVAKSCGVPVEAELGKVGGKEDSWEAENDANTDPIEAKEFVNCTEVDSLAIAIGTAHGFYKGVPSLDKARISEIQKLVAVPLVLHGASGLSDEEIRECISRGICKVNYATELRAAYTSAEKELFNACPDIFDPKKSGSAGMAAVKELVLKRIRVCSSDVKARGVRL